MYQVLTTSIRATLRDRKGISAMEYAILAAAILAVVGTAATSLGTEITNLFSALIGIIKTASNT